MAEPRVLVANRGEIAVRVIRTCREMGIPVVAVYSDADRESLHVEMADDAYHIGPSPPVESYLNVARILEAADRAGATMIHPGYGFLAENAGFARAVARAGFTFIGPPPKAMETMGDKLAARRAAEAAGAPVVPGTLDPVSLEDAMREAQRIGLPLLVKAAHGGGGKGMGLVERPEDLTPAIERCAREAASYFGRPEIYLERYLLRAHHVEAQILADAHGRFSFLGERDCSAQRRHQKLVEESPSPVVDDDLRSRIGEAAVAIARKAGYVNAGTVEFLVDPDGRFYFIEMNTRLQVEHPVTELVAGLDLVRLQILVALGEVVELTPERRGHALECRINAEDPARDFLPGPGVVTRYRPPEGPFVRVDSGIEQGRRIPGDYDSLVAKVIVWGEDRESARRRMLRALDELVVEGIPSTTPFHRWLLETEEFRSGSIHTRFVEEALEAGAFTPAREPRTRPAETPPRARPVKLMVEVDGRRVPVSIWDDGFRSPPQPMSAEGKHQAAGEVGVVVTAPMQGTILAIFVEPGQQIEAGETICILEAMKMENHIQAHREGTVTRVAVSKGDVVEGGQPIAVIE